MMTARRRGRSSFLSQIPEVPKSASGPDALSEFFNAVQKVYERVNEVIETAKSGFNLDVAKATMGYNGGARYWNEQAFVFLKKAKIDGLLNDEEANGLSVSIMQPLGEVLGKADAAIITGQDELLSIATYWKDTAALIASKTTGFFGKNWHDAAKIYRIVSDYVASGDAYLADISQAASSNEAKAAVAQYKTDLEKMRAQKLYIETAATAAGIPLDALKKQAQEEEFTLGADPATGLMATAFTVFGVTVTYLAIVKLVIGVFVSVGTILTFIFPHVVTSLLHIDGLLLLEKKKALEQESILKKANSDATVIAITRNSDKTNQAIGATNNAATGLAEVTGQQELADKLKAKIAQERSARGLSTPIGEQPWMPWVLAIGGGALVALVLYKYVHRDA